VRSSWLIVARNSPFRAARGLGLGAGGFRRLARLALGLEQPGALEGLRALLAERIEEGAHAVVEALGGVEAEADPGEQPPARDHRDAANPSNAG
jgi:hypothetical protein